MTFIRFNYNKTLFAVGTLDNFIRIISVEDYKEVSKFETEGEEITVRCLVLITLGNELPSEGRCSANRVQRWFNQNVQDPIREGDHHILRAFR